MIQPRLTLQCRGCGRIDRFTISSATSSPDGVDQALQCPRCGSGVFGPPGLGKENTPRPVERRRMPRPASKQIVPGQRKITVER